MPRLPKSFRRLPSGPYALTDRRLAGGRSLEVIVAALLAGGVRIIQIRERYLEGTAEGARVAEETGGKVHPIAPGALRDAIRRCLNLTRVAGAVLLVNDDPELAAECDADGVHVGQDDCPPRHARSVIGPDRLLGLSTHTPEQFLAALDEPIDYVAVGPVFGTTSKESPYSARGLEYVAWAWAEAKRIGIPLVAIGGISLAHVPDLLRAAPGCHPAAIGALMTEGDIAARAREFIAAMNASLRAAGNPSSHLYPSPMESS